jgi:GNAT superfamily N-acetyltransferase
MNPITVRQSVLSDLDALVPLFDAYRQGYGRAGDLAAARSFLLARFDHGESEIFVAQDGAAMIGFAQLHASFSSLSMARVLVVSDLFVDEASREQGVGTKLLAASLRYAQSLGAVRLSLSAAFKNSHFQTVYEADGWKQDEQFSVYHFPVEA